jgi:predicted nucleic acid-binding protein
MTYSEILEGAYRLKNNLERYRKIVDHLDLFSIMRCNDNICRTWSQIRAEQYCQPIGVADAWIAATAIVYDIPLVTHNAEDFKGITRLKLITEYYTK